MLLFKNLLMGHATIRLLLLRRGPVQTGAWCTGGSNNCARKCAHFNLYTQSSQIKLSRFDTVSWNDLQRPNSMPRVRSCLQAGTLFPPHNQPGLLRLTPLRGVPVVPTLEAFSRQSCSHSRSFFMARHQTRKSELQDDDVFYLFLQKQKSAQRYIPQGYFPPYETV
jgi:hypothetical protein